MSCSYPWICALSTTLTAKPDPGRKILCPPAMHPLPSIACDPHHRNANVRPINGGLVRNSSTNGWSCYKDVKAIFKDNPIELFTKGHGARSTGSRAKRGLKGRSRKTGAELHSIPW